MILDFTFNQVMKLSSIKRWAIIEMSRPQSVAEHSYNVAMITLSVINTLERNGEYKMDNVEKHTAMGWALCHDLTEILTGDFPSSLKEHFGNDIAQMEKDKFPCHHHLKRTAEQFVIPKIVVKAADLVDAIQYAKRFCVDDGKEKILMDMRDKLRVLLNPEGYGKDVCLEINNALCEIYPELWND